MNIKDETHARAHPAYNDSLRQAVRMAAEGSACGVYWDGYTLAVHSTFAPRPADSIVICIAEKWDDRTVQLRFAGAHSEWVKL